MNTRGHRYAVLGCILCAMMLAPLAQLHREVGAQEATPAGAPMGTSVPSAQTWHVLVNNISPPGENWSFTAFYPDQLQAHPGDTIVFTLAPNPTAFHAVEVLFPAMTPMEFYQGFNGGFRQPDLTQPGVWQSTFWGVDLRGPCGREGQDPCPMVYSADDIAFGINSGVLVNPPPGGGEGNTSFAVALDPEMPLGPYYVLDLVAGPAMNARIDLVAPDQPVQSQEQVQAAAERQYQADLMTLSGLDRISGPAEASNPDGTKTWQVAAGLSAPSKPWLSINEFVPAQMVIRADDTVTWTHQGPGSLAHTVSGFAATADAIPDLNPYQAGCLTSSGELQLPPAGSFPSDVWNTCVGSEVNNFTEFSKFSAPSSAPYVDGPRTSGILLNEDFLDSPVGEGLPYESSYSVTFENPGTYYYQCAIHPGMVGTVVVIPQPMPR